MALPYNPLLAPNNPLNIFASSAAANAQPNPALPGYNNGGDPIYGMIQAPISSTRRPLTDTGSETGGAVTGGSSSSSTKTSYDPQTVALYDQGIQQANSAIGRLDNQFSVGSDNILNAYNDSLNKLLNGKALAERNYNTTKDQTTQDNVTARSNIDYSVGRQANALQRLLGSRGSGSSSAALIAAPYAAALQGTQQRQQVQDAFGRNMQSLDTNWQDYLNNFDTTKSDLEKQRYSNENSLKADIANKRATLLSTLANLNSQRSAALGGSATASVAAAQPYLSQVNDLYTQVDSLGRQYANPINVQTPTYAAPNLAQYNYDKTVAPQVGNTSALTDTVSPYLSLLLRGKRQQAL